MDDHKLDLPNANVCIIHNYARDTARTFEYLRDHVNWQRDEALPHRPYCNMGTDYIVSSGTFRKGQHFDAHVLDLMSRLNSTFNVTMNSCYAMLYENGNAELPYRNNIEPQVDLDQPAFSISYGAPRLMTFKDVHTGEEYEFLLVDGDLLIMSDNCQRQYLYALKKSTQYIEPRISLGFRRFHDGTSF
jgi:alkylated DNA repair dioxygenase AlkB